MKIQLVSDSSANRGTRVKRDVAYVPLKIVSAEKEYVDDGSLDVTAMLAELKTSSGKTGTACPSVQEWMDAFDDADMVLGTAITSGLSGSYNSGVIAAETYRESHPNAKVCLIDSLSAGPELQLILEKFDELLDKTEDFDTITREIRTYHQHTNLIFALASVNSLVKNGRLNPILGKAIGLLGLRIIGKASEEGTLQPLHKSRGEKKAIQQLVQSLSDEGYKGGKVRISHTDNLPAARDFAAQVKQKWPTADIDIVPHTGLCGYYAEEGGLMIGFES